MAFIVEQDVREALLDLEPAEEQIEADLAFTPEKIAAAMRRASRRFNSLAPYSVTVQPDRMPADWQWMVSGVIAELYRARAVQLSRQEMPYTAGDVQVDLTGNRRRATEEQEKIYFNQFMEGALSYKRTVNARAMYFSA